MKIFGIIKRVTLYTTILLVIIAISPNYLYAENWIKVDCTDDEEVYVDTSHWENKKIWIQDGYHRDVQRKEWVDTSYTVNQGYWKNEEYNVWIESSKRVPYTAYRWVDTSHWERKYRYVTSWVPVNLTIYVGTSSYGWGVYSFAAKPAGKVTIIYKGNKYKAYKDVIDYRPIYGGRVYAVKYSCYSRETKVKKYYNVWVNSGYYQSYTAYRNVDTSHWETRTRRVWVDTSYKVKSGYWRYYTDKEWVDTSHFEYRAVWVEDGFFASPMHGEIEIEKNPKYVFTRWHENAEGDQCHMDLRISWDIDNTELLPGEEEKEIKRIYAYEDIMRFNNSGIERVEIVDECIQPSDKGSIETKTYFKYSGSEESILHVYLYARKGECVHIYFNNPVNGFRSINLGSDGSESDANLWLGGNYSGRIEF
jgi:hypothetical protein